MIRLALLVAVLSVAASSVLADAVRPVQIIIKEMPSGAFDVQWSVPKVMSPDAMPSPVLPDDAVARGGSRFVDRPGDWLTRQVYECPSGIAGQSVGVQYPFYNLGLPTLLRVEFLSGERYAQMLDPGVETWRVPDPRASGFVAWLEAASGAVAARRTTCCT